MVSNGAIPAGLLVLAAGTSGATLRPGTASRWAAIRNEVHARFGWWPEVTSAGDGYRSLARQVDLFRRNYTTTNTGYGPVKSYEGSLWWRKTAGTPSAATPGTSNHGLGTTVDVVNLGTLNQFTTTRYAQFAAVAALHKFSNTEGRSIGEPWHWSDISSPDVVTVSNPGDSTGNVPTIPDIGPIAPIEEIDMTPEQAYQLAQVVAQSASIYALLNETPFRSAQQVHNWQVNRVEGQPTTFLQDTVDGNTAAMQSVAILAAGTPTPTVDVTALAAALAQVLPGAVVDLDAADLEAIARAVNDEQHRRSAT